ncbi:hypothetical protein ACPV52_15340 [Vibrio astriarenae]
MNEEVDDCKVQDREGPRSKPIEVDTLSDASKKQKDRKEVASTSTKLDKIKYTVFVVSFYVYVSGALYFYGLMNSLGFSGASLDSIFSPLIYSQYFLAGIVNEIVSEPSTGLLWISLKKSVFLWVVLLCIAVIYKYRAEVIEITSKMPAPNLNNGRCIKKFIQESPIISALISFPILVISYFFVIIAFIWSLSIITIFLMLPYFSGLKAGPQLIEQNEGKICQTLDWSAEEHQGRGIILSCERIKISDNGDYLIGSVLHSDQKYAYVIANEFLVKVKNGQVVSCLEKQKNTNEKSKAEDSDGSYDEGSASLSCDVLYNGINRTT